MEYVSPESVHGVVCGCWHPSGKAFVTGHPSGDIIQWGVKSSKHLGVLALNSNEGSKALVSQLIWTTNSTLKTDYLLVVGGIAADGESASVSASLVIGMIPSKGGFTAIRAVALSTSIIDVVAIAPSPYPVPYDDARCFCFLTSDGKISMQNVSIIKNELVLIEGVLTPTLQLQDHNNSISVMRLYQPVTSSFIDDIKHSGTFQGVDSIPKQWALSGGAMKSVESSALAVTGHRNGMIRMWTVSNKMMLVYEIPRPKYVNQVCSTSYLGH